MLDKSKFTDIEPRQFFTWWANEEGLKFYYKTLFIRECLDNHNEFTNMRTTALKVFENKHWLPKQQKVNQ